jgi:hypothetical protein
MKTLLSVICSLAFISLLCGADLPPAIAKETQPVLKIVKDELVEVGYFYNVKGVVYNPHERPVKNVVIKYRVWKKLMGRDGNGSVIKETGGLVTATIKFIPPKQSVDFTASDRTAPIMAKESGLYPDPLVAEISAEWDMGN